MRRRAEAILDRLEELEDIDDLTSIRHEPTRSLPDVLTELDLDGSSQGREQPAGREAAQAPLPRDT